MGCGRLFEGTPAQMWHSLQKLLALPDETRVYCAHEYTQKNARFALTVEPHNQARAARGREVESKPGDPASAKAALDRIALPQDALDRIAGIAPRSSLIITDEAPSSETGKGTDFVILLSGEPQGGIKIRRQGPGSEFRNTRRRDRSPFLGPPFAGPFSAW